MVWRQQMWKQCNDNFLPRVTSNVFCIIGFILFFTAVAEQWLNCFCKNGQDFLLRSICQMLKTIYSNVLAVLIRAAGEAFHLSYGNSSTIHSYKTIVFAWENSILYKYSKIPQRDFIEQQRATLAPRTNRSHTVEKRGIGTSFSSGLSLLFLYTNLCSTRQNLWSPSFLISDLAGQASPS